MLMKTPDLKHKVKIRGARKFGAVSAIVLYFSLLVTLFILVYGIKQGQPQVKDFSVNRSNSTLAVMGKNLSPEICATALYRFSGCEDVVARKFMWERVFDVKVKGSTAWVLCLNIGLVALDISNPEKPEIIQTLHINKHLWHLKIVNNTAYIACGKDGVVVCDISSPARPRIISTYKLPYHSTDVSADDDMLYAGNGKHGVSVVDRKTNRIRHHLEISGTTLRVATSENKLFAFGKDRNKGFVRIYSIQDKSAPPRFIQHLEFEGTPRDYLIKDDVLFLANGRSGIGIVKFNKNGNAMFVHAMATPFQSNRLAGFGDKVVAFGRMGDIALYSHSGGGNINFTRHTHACTRIFGGDIFGHFAITAANTEGIRIVDLTSESRRINDDLITQLPTRSESINWQISSKGIFVRDADKLHYLKRNPAGALQIAGEVTYPQEEFFRAYKVHESAIYAAIKNSGLHVAKILPDGSLQAGAIIKFPQYKNLAVYSIEVHQQHLYLCTTKGLRVFDISVPDHPVYLPEHKMEGNIRSIVFGNGFAYIASHGDGIKICPVNSNNTLGPAEIIRFPEHLVQGGNSLDVTFSKGFLFAACGYRGLLSIDVRKPHKPVVLDSIEMPGYCRGVQVKDGILGTMSSDTVYLFDIQNPEQVSMLGEITNIKDFHLEDHELMQLHHEGILSSPLPQSLQLVHSSSSRLEFSLPEGISKGKYSLFLNLDRKRSNIAGILSLTPSGSGNAGWEFTPTLLTRGP